MAGFDHVFYEKLTVELKNESNIICFSEENDGVIVSCNGIERMLFRNGGTDGMIDSVGKYEISVGNSSIDKVY